MRMPVIAFSVLATLLIGVNANAQLSRTDIGLSFYGAFTGTTEGNGTIQSPSNTAGGLVELRHIRNPLIGYEANYSYNRANQSYSTSENFTEVKAAAHEFGADWLVSVPILNLRPFVLAGLGGLYFRPDSDQPGTSSELKLVYVYGGGLDWTVIPHLGLRFQYRGNLYHAPDMLAAASSTNAFAHTAEPMFGAYFRF